MAIAGRITKRRSLLQLLALIAVLHYLHLVRLTIRSLTYPMQSFLDEGLPSYTWESLANATSLGQHFVNQSTLLEPTYCDTSIVVTSSLIPTFPNIWIVESTINSVFRYLDGFCPAAETPLFIVMDVLKPDVSALDRKRYIDAQFNIKRAFPKAKVFAKTNPMQQGHIHSVKLAVDQVQTKYMYLIQHDLRFIAYVNHTGLIKTMNEYDELDIVRFESRRNKLLKPEKQGMECFGKKSVLNDVNAVHFTKSASWSDYTNQFAPRQYFSDLLQKWYSKEYVDPLGPFASNLPMEKRMMAMAALNCSRYGTWLYGRQDIGGPYVAHLDGKRTTHPPTAAPTKPRLRLIQAKPTATSRPGAVKTFYFFKKEQPTLPPSIKPTPLKVAESKK